MIRFLLDWFGLSFKSALRSVNAARELERALMEFEQAIRRTPPGQPIVHPNCGCVLFPSLTPKPSEKVKAMTFEEWQEYSAEELAHAERVHR